MNRRTASEPNGDDAFATTAPVMAVAPVAPVEPATDDVVDGAAELPAHELMRKALAACNELIAPAYVEADRQALRIQYRHRLVVNVAATLGTAAIVAALLQLLSFGALIGRLALVFDAVFTLVAASAVLLGVRASLQQRWYLYRHRAELLRLLKYRSLLVLASREDRLPFDRWRSQLAADVARIGGLDRPSMDEWIERGSGDMAPPVDVAAAAAAALFALRDYYARKRLGFQRAYFTKKVAQYQATDRWLRIAPTVLFMTSIAFACVHFAVAAVEKLDRVAPEDSHTSAVLIVVSAICVVAAGGFRAIRGANEYARNVLRFRAKIVTLELIASRLTEAAQPAQIAITLAETERVLEEEHREWLQLMREADWFG